MKLSIGLPFLLIHFIILYYISLYHFIFYIVNKYHFCLLLWALFLSSFFFSPIHLILSLAFNMQVYFDYMRSFRTEFDDLFAEGLISAVEIGLGASGELKYPSFSERMGWIYPGIGEFQVSVKANPWYLFLPIREVIVNPYILQFELCSEENKREPKLPFSLEGLIHSVGVF